MDDEFGNKLKALRQAEGWSQDQLARELNVSRQAVYKWESNRGYPDIKNLIRISDIFGVTIDDMIKSDKKLQNKISIDEDEKYAQVTDPGFYIGLLLVVLGLFLFDGSLSVTFMILGMMSIAFFTDFMKSLYSFFK
ncbi:helix-turn-helix transcriptional regulator [Salinicoccus hispanicus]|uniref:Helix-turn-helix domain-containing protein n=1 Tax=Salinicoccus hispanicus TaxID=157225 RepID=A0A6N8U5S2_9STAP|nr:helix-turn-helix transcriptional regulator [Salinicoccus hispanicus]MXQ51651.1 helix-turn-helix domain-containing protein [Salinicoccus hispanicus]